MIVRKFEVIKNAASGCFRAKLSVSISSRLLEFSYEAEVFKAFQTFIVALKNYCDSSEERRVLIVCLSEKLKSSVL